MNKAFLPILIFILILSCPAYAQYPTPSGESIAPFDPYANISLNSLKSDYETELSLTKASGYPTRLSEILPPPVKPSENAELIYLRLQGKDNEFIMDEDERDATAELNSPVSKINWKKLTAFVSNHHELLAVIHKAALLPHYNSGRKPDDYPMEMLFNNLTVCRRAVRILMVESLLLAHQGKRLEAIDNMALEFRISNQASEEIGMIAWAVSNAMNIMTYRALSQITVLSKNDDIALQKIRLLLENWKPEPLNKAYKDELAMQCANIAYQLKKGPDPLDYKSAEGSTAQEVEQFNKRCYGEGFVLIRVFRSLVQAADKPYSQVLMDRVGFLKRIIGDKPSPRYMLDTTINMPDKQVAAVATHRVAQLISSVFEYRFQHGVYPDNLSILSTIIPLDPYDLKPMRYHRETDGFVIYSVGPSGKYEGKVHDERRIEDIVFRYSEKNGELWR